MLKKEMLENFSQKRKFGLIQFGKGGNLNQIEQLAEKPEVVMLFANYDPESSKLRKVLKDVRKLENADLRIAVATFLGYGLFKENIYELEEFKKKFAGQANSSKVI